MGAGAVVNRTETVVGVSNLFATDGDLDGAWRDRLAAIGRSFPGLSVVGYESGDALAVARRVGFRAIGPLRIWAHEG